MNIKNGKNLNSMNIEEAKRMFKDNFIGPNELNSISSTLKISRILLEKTCFPPIPDIEKAVKDSARDYVLVLGIEKHHDGIPISIKSLRDIFGMDPQKREPCFYNQDWYINEKFTSISLKNKWYLIKKTVDKKTRRKDPNALADNLQRGKDFPPAILTAFTFFSYFLINKGAKLWKNDFVWCADKDSNGDRVYTGRYLDSNKKNKNGFNIHRHLSLKLYYALAPMSIITSKK